MILSDILIYRYVPPLLWGKSGHIQTIIYGKMGRINSPFPKGERCRNIMPDGATMTYDVFEPQSEHVSQGKNLNGSINVYCLIDSLNWSSSSSSLSSCVISYSFLGQSRFCILMWGLCTGQLANGLLCSHDQKRDIIIIVVTCDFK